MRARSALLVLAACGHPANTLGDGSFYDPADGHSTMADGRAGSADAPGAPADSPASVSDARPDSPADAGHSDAPPDPIVVDAGVDAPVNAGPPPTTQIFNAWPKIANPGSTLMLEGTFAGNAVVRFPGGATATMNALSAHRASVVVPVNSGLGNLALDATPDSHVVFHAHDYQLGFQKIEPYEQTDTARQQGLLAEPVYGHGSVTIGKYVYVIGGNNGTFSTHVQRATLNADGTLGNFAIVPGVALIHGRVEFATLIVGNYIYVIGGLVEGTGALAQTIESAPIYPDGTIGTFSVSPSALVVPRTDLTAAVIGNYIYVMGGTFLDSVERAPINTDGTIGSFQLLMNVKLALGVAGASAQVIGDQLYVIGGATSSQGSSHGVQAARIRNDGTIGTFAPVPGVTMFSGRAGMATAVLGDWLYVFGGGFDYMDDDMLIERAPIHGDHTLGTFQSTHRWLPQRRYGLTVAFAGDTVHVIGGEQGPGTYGEWDIYRATIDNSGGLMNFAVDPATAPARYGQGLVTSGDGVYLLGGMTGASTYTASVARATVVEGNLGSFSNQPAVTLRTPRAGFATAVIGTYVYVIGGRSATGVIGTIERAPIAPDGTLGTFAPYAGSLFTPRADFSAAVINGYTGTRYLYVLGGIAADGTVLGSVEKATIAADGSIGAFVTVAGATMTTPRYQAAILVHQEDQIPGSFFYLVGGRDANGAYLGDIERGNVEGNGNYYGSIHLDGVSLGTARAGAALSLIGNQLYVIGGANAGGAVDSVEVATFGPDAAAPLTAFAPASGVHLHDARSSMSCTVIANELYAVGGQNASGALGTIEHAKLH
jgi:hypothetical protein